MKKIIPPIFIAALLLSISCKKSDIYKSIDGCPVDSSISTNYLNDAKEIVYSRILSGDHVSDSNQPIFNQQELDRVLSAIQSVYALHSAQTDSIFNIYQIHAFRRYLLNSVILQVDINAPEIKNLTKGNPSGNVLFDDFLAKYGFSYNTAFPPGATLPFINFTTNTWYNLQAILPVFKSFPFILGAQADGSAGDGNNITYRLNGNQRIIDFSFGYGDCPAGCIGRSTWEFNVDENCRASFVKFSVTP
ncbi:MAG TPA: hypothetical protein VIM16_06620 [Mucilaginibacter sp.]|jgi:hypothetical protein